MTTSVPEPNGPVVRPFQGAWPRIDATAWVAPGAVVVGDVAVGPDSSIWYGSVVRGDVHRVRVGARTNLQDRCVVHVTRDLFSCELGDEVTVGHGAIVHGCRVEDGALVGIGAVVLDGVHIGEGAVVGAGAVVAPGTRVEPGMLVLGVPARAARPATPEERATHREIALAYVETARAHAASAPQE